MAHGFRDFLARNSVRSTTGLPLVHTTQAYFLRSILKQDAIVPQWCDVFRKDVSYFFVGRPAFKVRGGESEASEWELPCCFILQYDAVLKPTRVFPFDSGAFAGGRMPNYLRMMNINEFDVAALADGPTRIIGAYFADIRSYFRGRAKGTEDFQREFSPGVFDAEIKAIHRLALDTNNAKLDDRRLSVELQTDASIELTVHAPLAVIAPLPYFEDESFRQHVVNNWNAQPISYRVSSLSVSSYYSQIYERVEKLYEKLGVL